MIRIMGEVLLVYVIMATVAYLVAGTLPEMQRLFQYYAAGMFGSLSALIWLMARLLETMRKRRR